MSEEEKKPEPSVPLPDDALAARKGFFDEIYASTQTSELKLKARTWRQQAATEAEKEEDKSLVYSEVDMDTIHVILNRVRSDFGPIFNKQGTFLDLGSGAGKACVAAALLHPFEKVVGIEKVQPLVEAATAAAEAYGNVQMPEDVHKPPLEFIVGDFAADFEAKLTDVAPKVTVCLAFATFYGQEQLDAMAKLAEAMPACSIFITVGQRLPEKLLIDLDRSPAKRYNVAAKKALALRGKAPEGIAIVAEPPENCPYGWFQVHSEEVQLAYGKSMFFIYKKIGAVFPFLQPEEAKFELTLSDPDSRLCANLFVKLSMKEKASNLVEVKYTKEDGTEEDFADGVPPGWEELEAIPKDGILKGAYKCAKEDTSFLFRKKLLEEYQYYIGGTGVWTAGAWEAAPVVAGA
jgi:SAM-dependent methyltransferase